MIVASNPTRVSWIDPAARQPICDVPWVGTSIVQADGTVNFCCYSNTVVGNVNQASFAEIWNGETMRQIRAELSDGRFPEPCRSTSCPIYRGDELHHIRDRMEGRHSARLSGTDDPHRKIREALEGSVLQVNPQTPRAGEELTVTLKVKALPLPVTADLFVCIRRPGDAPRFLPSLDDCPVPVDTAISLGGRGEKLISVWRGSLDGFAVGDHEICAALFEQESNPNILSNCYWATTTTLAVQEPSLLHTAWGRVQAMFGRPAKPAA